jgi:hypothetical protein
MGWANFPLHSFQSYRYWTIGRAAQRAEGLLSFSAKLLGTEESVS